MRNQIVQPTRTATPVNDARFTEAEECFRQLAEHMDEVFFVVDAQYRETIYVSPQYEDVWGVPCDTLYENPRSFLDEVKPEDVPLILRQIAILQAGEDAGDVEFRIVRPDGELRWIHNYTAPVRDQSGHVSRLAGICTDVTARRLAMEAVQESEARYRLLSETLFDGIAVSENGVIMEANAGFAEMFGYRVDDLIGTPMIALVADESVVEASRRVRQQVGGRYELIAKHRDGHLIRLDAASNSLRIRGVPRRITAVRDITERHALERKYLQAQKMEAVGRLAGGIAHDFNNLLTVITSYGGLVLAENTLSEPMREDMSEIRKAAESAATLTRQLLAFSRQQPVEAKPLDLNEIVKRAGKMLTRVIGEDVTLVAELDPNLGCVFADAGQIEQVLMNMAVNARDAMPEGGRLTISTGRSVLVEDVILDHAPREAGSYVTLAINDTGTGMDEQTRAQIFEPFFTTKGAGKGTGLGLSTVYGIVQQCKGSVTVDSVLGEGTTFTIFLPSLDAPAIPDAEPVELDAPGRCETILLVEDVQAVRDVVHRVLSDNGYIVLDAVDADAAIERVASFAGSIDLLLTDIMLPGRNGRVLASELQAKLPELKVLFTSGYNDDEILRRNAQASEFAFIAKPFSSRALLQKVREVLEREPLSAPSIRPSPGSPGRRPFPADRGN
jgi:PAS domain S-box-containing protein